MASGKPVVSMVRHIQNRNNGYTRPSHFSVEANYSSLQTIFNDAATHGATATYGDRRLRLQEEVAQQEARDAGKPIIKVNKQRNMKLKLKYPRKSLRHSENEIRRRISIFSERAPTEFEEESFEKIENETQLIYKR